MRLGRYTSHGRYSPPHSIRDIARAVGAPEISTRNRLSRLETAGAVSAHRALVATPSGKPAVGTHYCITQFGRDCTGSSLCSTPTTATVATASVWQHATSVFAWGAARVAGAKTAR
ncbi:MAG: hypothetical protein CFE43_19980 [Burkholderiales bacterium PBB3]|nr:MAG: hypothetical protein CFE43_19980 [Burkholderiales bacterium PBB3]